MEKSNNETKTPQKHLLLHVLIITFPAPGHVIPLLDLTRRLLGHRDSHLNITFLITPPCLSLLQPLLSSFPPPQLQPLILSPPPLPTDTTSPTSRIRALHALSDPIISWCGSQLNPPRVIISDFFCSWTHKVCSHLDVPRVVFYPSGAFSCVVLYSMWQFVPDNPTNDPDFEVSFNDVAGSPVFKWSELSFLFRSGKTGDPDWDIFRADLLTNLTSFGAVLNSFSNLEKVYVDQLMAEMGHNRVWAVGPLLPDDVAQVSELQCEEVMTWLNQKADCSVVYICFGSRTSLTNEESTVLSLALEQSKVDFIWCVREVDGEEGMNTNTSGCECDHMSHENGLIIKGWAPQRAILKHRAVCGFLTHCGWNSIMEAIWSGVVMLAWPMGADQYSNAQLVVDQLGLGFRVNCNNPTGVPSSNELAQLLTKSVTSTRSEKERVMRMRNAATSTIKSGNSATNLDQFIKSLCECNI